MQTRVLPKSLRKPARIAQRLLSGETRVPKFVEPVVFGGFIAFCGLYGSLIGGQLQNATESLAVSAGFGLSEIEISGNTHTRIEDVYRVLGVSSERSLVGLDVREAHGAVVGLPWVQQAKLRKVYPSTLAVDVTEREPFALWQMGDAITVIEEDGAPIGPFAVDPRIAALPLVVGTGAAQSAKPLLDELSAFPWLSGQVHAAIRVGDRRWDLRLRNGMTIRLPEYEVGSAIARLEFLDVSEGVLSRDLAAIDLRFEDRTVFALTQNASAERDAFVEDRAKRLDDLKRQSSI